MFNKGFIIWINRLIGVKYKNRSSNRLAAFIHLEGFSHLAPFIIKIIRVSFEKINFLFEFYYEKIKRINNAI